VIVAVDGEQLDRPLDDIVIAAIAGQLTEIVGIGRACFRRIEIVISERRKESIDRAPRSKGAEISADIFVVILPDIGIDGAALAAGIIVVAEREDEIRVPRLDQFGDVALVAVVDAVIAEGGKAHRSGRQRWQRVRHFAAPDNQQKRPNRQYSKQIEPLFCLLARI
jgi:hypothetical protein